MTTKQIDKLLGHEIKVRWPAYNQTDTLVPILRRKGTRLIEARVKSYGGRPPSSTSVRWNSWR